MKRDDHRGRRRFCIREAASARQPLTCIPPIDGTGRWPLLPLFYGNAVHSLMFCAVVVMLMFGAAALRAVSRRAPAGSRGCKVCFYFAPLLFRTSASWCLGSTAASAAPRDGRVLL